MSIYRGNLSHHLGEISNKADWASPAIEFYDDADGEQIALSALSDIYFEVKDPLCGAIVVSASLSGGKIVALDDYRFSIQLMKSDTGSLKAGQYLANISFTADDLKHDPVLAEITVFDGAG